MLAQMADSNLNAISFFDWICSLKPFPQQNDTAFVSQVKTSEQHVLADPQ